MLVMSTPPATDHYGASPPCHEHVPLPEELLTLPSLQSVGPPPFPLYGIVQRGWVPRPPVPPEPALVSAHAKLQLASACRFAASVTTTLTLKEPWRRYRCSKTCARVPFEKCPPSP